MTRLFKWEKLKQLNILICLLSALLLAGCGGQQADGKVDLPDYQEEYVNVKIPGLTENYTFLLVADLHIVEGMGDVSEDKLQEVQLRKMAFVNDKGVSSEDQWKELPDTLNSVKADGILFGGDMIDYASTANIEMLGEGLKQLESPFMYVRADHDYGTWYGSLSDEEVRGMQEELDHTPSVIKWEYDQFIILGIDNNTSQISAEMLEEIKSIFAIGKPIILLTHVPFNSLVDDSLDAQSKAAWGDRNLTWGDNCYYVADANTREFMDLIFDENSPVVEILSGHLHFTWDGYINDKVHQHVFSAAYQDAIGVVTITGE